MSPHNGGYCVLWYVLNMLVLVASWAIQFEELQQRDWLLWYRSSPNGPAGCPTFIWKWNHSVLYLTFNIRLQHYFSCSIFGWNTWRWFSETLHSNMEKDNGLPNGSFQNWDGWLLLASFFHVVDFILHDDNGYELWVYKVTLVKETLISLTWHVWGICSSQRVLLFEGTRCSFFRVFVLFLISGRSPL